MSSCSQANRKTLSSLQGRHWRGHHQGPQARHVRPQGKHALSLSLSLPTAPKLTANVKQGKAKQGAWQKVVDEGLTAAEAQAKYVELVETLKVTYGYDANKEPEAVGN